MPVHHVMIFKALSLCGDYPLCFPSKDTKAQRGGLARPGPGALRGPPGLCSQRPLGRGAETWQDLLPNPESETGELQLRRGPAGGSQQLGPVCLAGAGLAGPLHTAPASRRLSEPHALE